MDAPSALCEPVAPARLFNDWQRALPLVPRPFDAIGRPHGLDGVAVRRLLREGIARGEVSRVGAVFGIGAGGVATLAALRVPPARLDDVAALVSAEPGVSHNYAREHDWNLWFVASAPDAAALDATLARIARATGLAPLRLPMRRAYRIDLGFDLYGAPAQRPHGVRAARPVTASLRPLAARLESGGVPLVERPYAALGAALGLSEARVMSTFARWLVAGTLRRLGVVLRHHEFGIAANAMTVFAPAEADVDAAGERLAAQPGVTLCYRRESAPGWPYTLYCMVHGRERAAVQELVDRATQAAGLDGVPRQVLFSSRRYKQTGSRYFAS
ncbi:MAG TPA: Lrp/AsnC family transcriptional regulator [Ideonella sp.]|nr:Lrp/AsnC family transcriptional regulator [Ideonella sp.]